MLTTEEAIEIIMKSDVWPDVEEVCLIESQNRVLAQDVVSPIEIPGFTKSLMDGYAINSSDYSECFEVIEVIYAGNYPEKEIKKGQCSKIMTGAALPKGADKVVKVECTQVIDEKVFVKEKEQLNYVVLQGEYVKKGDRVIKKGTIVASKEIGVLASLGISTVKVYKKTSIGLFSTGDELTQPGEELLLGKIYDSNSFQLRSQIETTGAICNYYGTIKDEREQLKKAIEEAAKECQMVLVSGGMSMGEKDYIPGLLKELDFQIEFYKVAVKPGKPLLFGKKNCCGKNVFAFGIPGNPVSAFISFEIFIKPLIYKSMGYDFKPVIFSGEIKENLKRVMADRNEFIPVKFDGKNIYPVNYKTSDHINALVNANAIIELGKGVFEIKKGDRLDVRQI